MRHRLAWFLWCCFWSPYFSIVRLLVDCVAKLVLFQRRIYWGGRGPGAELVLHFPFAAISICPGKKSWSIYELPPDCALILFSLVFTLVLNWRIIIMLLKTYSVISVMIVLANKQTGSYSKIYRNCFYVPCEERTLRNPWVKSLSCIKITSRGKSWRCSWRLSCTFLNQQLTMWKN